MLAGNRRRRVMAQPSRARPAVSSMICSTLLGLARECRCWTSPAHPVSSWAQHGCVAPCPRDFDFAAAMIGLARAAHPAIRFEEGDAEALPFADASFDAVISNFGIHHLPDPVQAPSEARRILRPDGRI